MSYGERALPDSDNEIIRMTSYLTQFDEISTSLSYVLRYELHAIGSQLDLEGRADIGALIVNSGRHGRVIDKTMIQAIVSSGGKKRFALSDDFLKIQAIQGHSISAYGPRTQRGRRLLFLIMGLPRAFWGQFKNKD